MHAPERAVRHPALIDYPPQSAFGRVMPKNKIYSQGHANKRVKELFVKQVNQIIWAFKLAPETIRLPQRDGVQEIQILRLELKTAELSHDVLRCIDASIPSRLIFELTHAGCTQVIAAYKRPNESDSARWVLSDYFATDWLPKNCARSAMPVALNMAGLYEQLLYPLLPLRARPHERLCALIERVQAWKVKKRELDALSAKLAREKQFNRKVEINAALRQLRSEVELLTS